MFETTGMTVHRLLRKEDENPQNIALLYVMIIIITKLYTDHMTLFHGQGQRKWHKNGRGPHASYRGRQTNIWIKCLRAMFHAIFVFAFTKQTYGWMNMHHQTDLHVIYTEKQTKKNKNKKPHRYNICPFKYNCPLHRQGHKLSACKEISKGGLP